MNKKEFANDWIRARIGALESPVDRRSLPYMKTPDIGALAATPAEYRGLKPYVPDNTARSQGSVGSCVGWDWNYIYETQLTLLLKYLQSIGRENTIYSQLHLSHVLELVTHDMSAGWAYQQSRKHSIPPVPPHIEGSTNLGAVRAAEKIGICTETLVKTDITAPFAKINETPEMYAEALDYRIASYHNIMNDSETLKTAMYGGLHELPYKMPDGSLGASPLMSAFPVYENFKDSYDDGIVPLPKGRLLGGHSSPLYAWRVIDGKEHWGNFGSWGPDIADQGWFWIPFDYPFYPNDFWLLKIAATTEPPSPTCITESGHVFLGILNWFNSDAAKFYYGTEVN